MALEADASREPDVARAVVEGHAALGGLDGLVLNVGVAGGRGFADTSSDVWDQVFAVNVRAHFLACKHAMALLSPGGAIVFVSSTAALLPTTTDIPAYAASKAALGGLCRHAAHEGAPRGVRANVVMPGLIDTPLGRLATLVRPQRAATPIPLEREGTGWDVAQAVAFLLSDRAGYITGQTLVVDGGLTGVA